MEVGTGVLVGNEDEKRSGLMSTDVGALSHCVCGAALDDNGKCSSSTCYVSVPETHLRNPVWPLGTSLCGRATGEFVSSRPTCRKCGRMVSRARPRKRGRRA